MTGLTMSMDICAFIDQELHNLKVTMLRGNVETGVSILV
jgi:porphobilinogen deaminase